MTNRGPGLWPGLSGDCCAVLVDVALTISQLAYVEAGRAAGGSSLRIMVRHVLPQCVAPYLVLIAVLVLYPRGILGESHGRRV